MAALSYHSISGDSAEGLESAPDPTPDTETV